MATYSFSDDYSEGCHPAILEALAASNLEQQTAYGNDEYSIEARRVIAAACGNDDVPVFFVSGGTLANLIIIAAALRPHEAVIAAESGHIESREAGAIEATGHKILTAASSDGRLTPDDIDAVVAANGQAPHMAKPAMVYVSNATEFGTVYSLAEMQALRAACDQHGLLLMVDGARLGVALHSPRAQGLTLETLAELTDVFWIGGTKSGTLFGEAIVIPNSRVAADFGFHIKQRGALLAKGRSLGIQFQELFTNGVFASASKHANAAAQAVAAGIVGAGYDLASETESNQVFAVLPNSVIDRLHANFAFYVWRATDDDHAVVRLVTSWATPDTAINDLVTQLTAERS